MYTWITQYASPKNFCFLVNRLTLWFGWLAVILFILGLYGALFYAPPDYQQGESFRIIYVHVPSAWMSMFVYIVMAASGAVGLIWKTKVSYAIARSCAPLGVSFTFLALVTGSLWGKPMWGTWWVWDARLTSELILLFLYLGYLALQSAIDDRRTAARAGAVLALMGIVNIPIIHYSVVWWNTLHQGSTISTLDSPSIHIDMLIPLLIMVAAFMFYFFSMVLIRARSEIIDQEKNSKWARELARK